MWKSKFYGAFDAIDATPARWRGDAGSSPLDRASTAASSPRNDLVKNYRVHPTHWLISTQASTVVFRSRFPSAIAAATAPSPVRAPRTFSRSFMTFAGEKKCVPTCVEIKFYGAFVLNRRVNLHAIDAMPRWRGGVPVPNRSTEPARPRHRREMS